MFSAKEIVLILALKINILRYNVDDFYFHVLGLPSAQSLRLWEQAFNYNIIENTTYLITK